MLERIKFRVLHCTSEEVGYPGCELEKQGPSCNGWRSPRSVTYPQEIILILESRARLGHIQLLAHQYLIPEKIGLSIGEYVGSSEKEQEIKHDIENIKFLELGHVNLSCNQNTGYKARELKSITADCKGTLIKVTLYNNHKNKYNRHNQVALVAINLLGERLDEDDEMTRSASHITFEEINHNDKDKQLFSPFDDLSFTMYIDTEVQDFIRKLDAKKQEAVLDERFDFASKLKSSIEQLKKAGELLAKYQLEKQIAASREDFQRAKEKKHQMDTYRDNTYKALRVKELLEPYGRIPENDEPGKIPGVVGMSRSITETKLPQAPISAASTPESTTSDRYCRFASGGNTPDHEKKESGYQSFDEPRYPPVFTSYSRKSKRPHTAERPKPEIKDDMNPTSIFSTKPSMLSERTRRYAALPIQVFGEALVDKLFSKSFTVKEDGLKCLQEFLIEYKKAGKSKNDPPSKIFRAAIILLQKTIKDTVFGVYNLSVQTFTHLMDDFCRKHRMANSEMAQGLEKMLPELISKSGDMTLGKNKVATECILHLQNCNHIRVLNVISNHLTKPFDAPVHPKLAQSKSEMVEELLSKYGLSSDKYSGMTPRDYVEFAVSALNQPSENVRRVADRIVICMYRSHPRLVRQNLPLEEDISPRNIHYRKLFSQFDAIDKERMEANGMMITSLLKESKSTNAMTSSVYVPKM